MTDAPIQIVLSRTATVVAQRHVTAAIMMVVSLKQSSAPLKKRMVNVCPEFGMGVRIFVPPVGIVATIAYVPFEDVPVLIKYLSALVTLEKVILPLLLAIAPVQVGTV